MRKISSPARIGLLSQTALNDFRAIITFTITSNIKVCRQYFGIKTDKQLNILLYLKKLQRIEFVFNTVGFYTQPFYRRASPPCRI